MNFYILQIGPAHEDGPYLLGPFISVDEREAYKHAHSDIMANAKYRFFNFNAEGDKVCVGNVFFPPYPSEQRDDESLLEYGEPTTPAVEANKIA